MSINPYESPKADLGLVSSPAVGQLPIRIEGHDIVVPSGTVLPPRCVKTNEPVPEEEMVHKRFTWAPPWVVAMILINILVLILAYYLARKKCDVTYALHADVRRKYRMRIVYKSLITLALFFCIPVVAALNGDVAIVVAVIAFFVAVIVLVVGNSPLKVTAHKDGMFWIRGCSEVFLDSLAEENMSRGQLQDGWQ